MTTIKFDPRLEHAVRFPVSEVLLRQALALPDSSCIIGISEDPEIKNAFQLVVYDPNLPAVEDGTIIPQVMPRFTADYDKRPGIWISFDWNLENARRE